MLLATGGATGALLRYIVTNLSKNLFTSSIYGTLCVNLLGSFLIGYLITSDYAKNLSQDFVKFFLIIGLLGSFTTFSAFSYEVINLINSKKNTFIFSLYLYFNFLLYSICLFRNDNK